MTYSTYDVQMRLIHCFEVFLLELLLGNPVVDEIPRKDLFEGPLPIHEEIGVEAALTKHFAPVSS